ncbi:hypothetical protein V1477_006797 [Vespula maculifrons]|uniref:Uncharacterized protein n=1 Tax=Vespula maculifrons TaxID=7453 RepID=A0ABD2CGT2_VESMC
MFHTLKTILNNTRQDKQEAFLLLFSKILSLSWNNIIRKLEYCKNRNRGLHFSRTISSNTRSLLETLDVQSPRWRNAQLILSSNNEQDKTKEQDNSCCGSYREVSTAPDVPEFATDSLTRILTNV